MNTCGAIDSEDDISRFLQSDELRHISPIKMRALFGEDLHAARVNDGDATGYVFTMLREKSQWDTNKYPNAMYVVYAALPPQPSNALVDAAVRCALQLTHGAPFVAKATEQRFIEGIQRAEDGRTPLRYVLSLLTFVPSTQRPLALQKFMDDAVASNQIHDTIPQAAREFLAAHNVYSEAELQTLFADGSARCWVRMADDRPVAMLLTFANSPTLHEIGSVHVNHDSRKRGHASALVRSAILDLVSRGLKVRYVVEATNEASIAVAEKCGLTLATRMEHWVSRE